MDSLLNNKVGLISNTELLNFYKDIAQQQSANYSNLITAMIGVTAIFVGFTWYWNVKLSIKQIENEVSEQTSAIKEELSKELIKITNEKFVNFEQSLDIKIKAHEADLCRLYAISSYEVLDFSTSVSWWLKALEVYFLIGDHFHSRLCIDHMLKIVSMNEWLDAKDKDFNYDIAIRIINSSVHESMPNEKMKLIEAFKTKFLNSK